MRNEEFVLQPNSLWDKLTRKENVKNFGFTVLLLVGISVIIGVGVLLLHFQYERDKKIQSEKQNYVPDTTIPSMGLTVLNITETHLSVKGDLMIRIPYDLPGYYMCLKGDFQVFILYKAVTIATSSIESYNVIPQWAQLLNVSSIASKGDMDGVIVKDIMDDIKERGEIRLGSRLILTDCRYGTNGKMNYACDEATLRFEPGSQTKATLFGNNPTCHYVH